MRALTAILAVVMLATMAGCAPRQQLEVKDFPEETGPALPPIEVREVILGAGDEVDVLVWRQPDLTRRIRITRTGQLPYPLLGNVKATGLTAAELQEAITKRLDEYLVNPQVTVTITAIRHEKLFVFGEVQRPGIYPLDATAGMAIMDAIAMAGGLTIDAKKSEILLVRGNTKRAYIRPVDFNALLTEGNLRQNIQLAPGDIIYVPVSTMSSIAREADRITRILGPLVAISEILLNIQAATIGWDAFTAAVAGNGSSTTTTSSTFVIIPP